MQDIIAFLHNHLALTSALLAALFLLLLLEALKSRQSAKEVSPAQLTNMMNHQHAAVIDVRTSTQYNAGHIIGSLSIPLAELDNKLKKLEAFKPRPIVVACQTGKEAAQAANVLQKNAYQAYILSGGLQAWRDASLPVVKG